MKQLSNACDNATQEDGNRQLTASQLGERGGFLLKAFGSGNRSSNDVPSTRSGLQLLRVARTIADLDQMDSVPDDAIAQPLLRCSDLLVPRITLIQSH